MDGDQDPNEHSKRTEDAVEKKYWETEVWIQTINKVVEKGQILQI